MLYIWKVKDSTDSNAKDGIVYKCYRFKILNFQTILMPNVPNVDINAKASKDYECYIF